MTGVQGQAHRRGDQGPGRVRRQRPEVRPFRHRARDRPLTARSARSRAPAVLSGAGLGPPPASASAPTSRAGPGRRRQRARAWPRWTRPARSAWWPWSWATRWTRCSRLRPGRPRPCSGTGRPAASRRRCSCSSPAGRSPSRSRGAARAVGRPPGPRPPGPAAPRDRVRAALAGMGGRAARARAIGTSGRTSWPSTPSTASRLVLLVTSLVLALPVARARQGGAPGRARRSRPRCSGPGPAARARSRRAAAGLPALPPGARAAPDRGRHLAVPGRALGGLLLRRGGGRAARPRGPARGARHGGGGAALVLVALAVPRAWASGRRATRCSSASGSAWCCSCSRRSSSVPAAAAARAAPLGRSSLGVYAIHLPIVYGWSTIAGLSWRVGQTLGGRTEHCGGRAVLAVSFAAYRARRSRAASPSRAVRGAQDAVAGVARGGSGPARVKAARNSTARSSAQ